MKRRNSSARQQQILDLLAKRGELGVVELSGHFQVTEMTIRRDLDALEADGRVTRVHGGAILAAPSIVEFAFQERRQTCIEQKQAIAAEAVSRINPGMTIMLDTGTTTLETARALAGIRGLQVVTSSLAIASALLTHEELNLILLGGTVSRDTPDLFGPLTLDNLASFRVDIAFIGADAIDVDGLYTQSQQIAQVSKTMMAAAQKNVLLADSGKFGKSAFVRFAGWDQVDELICDSRLPAAQKGRLEKTVKHCTWVDG